MLAALSLLKNPWVNLGAVLAGAGIGLYAKPAASDMAPLGDLFLSLIKMCVLPIVATAITASVARLLRSGSVHRYLNRIIIVFAVGACMGAFAGIAAGSVFAPGENLQANSRKVLADIFSEAELQPLQSTAARKAGPWDLAFSVVPSNVFYAFTSDQSLAVIFVSLLLGIALGALKTDGAQRLVSGFDALYGAFFKILNWVLYGLPIGICCLVAAQVLVLGTTILLAMTKLIALFFGTCALLWVLYAAAMRMATGIPLGRLLAAMRDPLLVSFVTRSSIAAVPIALERMKTDLRQPEEVASLVIPLSVIINRHAFILLFSLTTVFVTQLFQMELSFGQQALLVVAAVFSGMAAVGAPSVIAPMIASVLVPLGLPASAGIAVLIAIGPIVDPIATMTNLFGGCATTAIVARARAHTNGTGGAS
jgi:proton glutamate symport protein